MSGRLPRSRSPPHPKTQMRRAGTSAAQRPEDAGKRVRGMGIVDQHGEVLTGDDRLEPARHARKGLETLRDRRERRPERMRRRRGREHVLEMALRRRGASRRRCARRRRRASRASRRASSSTASARTSPPAPKVTTGLAIVARRPTTLASAAFSTADAARLRARVERGEEPGLGAQVVVLIAVEVHVIAPEVGEDRRRPRGCRRSGPARARATRPPSQRGSRRRRASPRAARRSRSQAAW